MARFSLKGVPSFPITVDLNRKFDCKRYLILWGPNIGAWHCMKGSCKAIRHLPAPSMYMRGISPEDRKAFANMTLVPMEGYAHFVKAKQFWKHPVYRSLVKWAKDAYAKAQEPVPGWFTDFIKSCEKTIEVPYHTTWEDDTPDASPPGSLDWTAGEAPNRRQKKTSKRKAYNFRDYEGQVAPLMGEHLVFLYYAGPGGIDILKYHRQEVEMLVRYLWTEERSRLHMLKYFKTLRVKQAFRKCLSDRKKFPISDNVFNQWWRCSNGREVDITMDDLRILGKFKQIPKIECTEDLRLLKGLAGINRDKCNVKHFKFLKEQEAKWCNGCAGGTLYLQSSTRWLGQVKDLYEMFDKLLKYKEEYSLSHELNVRISEVQKLEKELTVEDYSKPHQDWLAHRLHDQVGVLHRKVMQIVEAEKLKQPYPEFSKPLPYWLEHIQSPADLMLEGKVMHHCIGSYATRGFGDPDSTYGRLVFFRVQWGEERASLAVLYCTKSRARGTYSVTEINSFQNQGVSDNLRKEVQYLVDTWNKGA